jgi:hypothetical protein
VIHEFDGHVEVGLFEPRNRCFRIQQVMLMRFSQNAQSAGDAELSARSLVPAFPLVDQHAIGGK